MDPAQIQDILTQAESTQAITIPFDNGASLLIGHYEGQVLVQVQPSMRPDGTMPDLVNMTLGSRVAEISGRLLLSYAERLRPSSPHRSRMN